MKRKALALILIIVIALSVASWLVYNQVRELQNQIEKLQAQNNKLQNQINASKLRIAQFLADESYGSPFMFYHFSAKIQNIDTTDVDNVLFEVLALNTTGNEIKRYTEHLGMLHSGENRKIVGNINIDTFLPSHFQLRAIVEWNGMIIDEQTIP